MFKVNNKDTRSADLEWLFRSHLLLILTVSSLSKKKHIFIFTLLCGTSKGFMKALTSQVKIGFSGQILITLRL